MDCDWLKEALIESYKSSSFLDMRGIWEYDSYFFSDTDNLLKAVLLYHDTKPLHADLFPHHAAILSLFVKQFWFMRGGSINISLPGDVNNKDRWTFHENISQMILHHGLNENMWLCYFVADDVWLQKFCDAIACVGLKEGVHLEFLWINSLQRMKYVADMLEVAGLKKWMRLDFSQSSISKDSMRYFCATLSEIWLQEDVCLDFSSSSFSTSYFLWKTLHWKSSLQSFRDKFTRVWNRNQYSPWVDLLATIEQIWLKKWVMIDVSWTWGETRLAKGLLKIVKKGLLQEWVRFFIGSEIPQHLQNLLRKEISAQKYNPEDIVYFPSQDKES